MLSQSVEYALRAMSHLATKQGSSASAFAISQITRVPHGYLSKIMRSLVRANLVRSFRGPNGGFVLARDPTGITVLDIVNAVDPIKRILSCPLDNPLHLTLCPLHKCLDDAVQRMQDVFRSTTLSSVLDAAGHAGACRSLFPMMPTMLKEDHP